MVQILDFEILLIGIDDHRLKQDVERNRSAEWRSVSNGGRCQFVIS